MLIKGGLDTGNDIQVREIYLVNIFMNILLLSKILVQAKFQEWHQWLLYLQSQLPFYWFKMRLLQIHLGYGYTRFYGKLFGHWLKELWQYRVKYQAML